MDPIPTTYSGAQLLMSIASSREPSRLIFPFSSQRSSNWPSTLRPPRRSASKFQTSCWPLPTRSSNDREDEAAHVHHAAQRRGGGGAARGARAAGGNPSDWVFEPRVARVRRLLPADRPPAGFERDRLR